jgi:4-amino-4-deoxy-L-arabinose transferase-like glycosyltransferase
MPKMKRRILPALYGAFILFALIGIARAEDDFLFSQFLETPLLTLAILIIIDVIAFIYHKIRK